MKLTADILKIDSRDDLREIIAALEKVPEELRTEAVKNFTAQLDFLEWMW